MVQTLISKDNHDIVASQNRDRPIFQTEQQTLSQYLFHQSQNKSVHQSQPGLNHGSKTSFHQAMGLCRSLYVRSVSQCCRPCAPALVQAYAACLVDLGEDVVDLFVIECCKLPRACICLCYYAKYTPKQITNICTPAFLVLLDYRSQVTR
jgi:hypothetical protein